MKPASRSGGGSLSSEPQAVVVGVVVYGLVLGNMVQRACGRCFAACESGIDAKIPDRVIAPTDGPTGSLAVGGALFFLMSDSLLAWNRFVNPWPTAPAWIMTTYWLAILLISMSALFFSEPVPVALPPAAIETAQNPSEKKQE